MKGIIRNHSYWCFDGLPVIDSLNPSSHPHHLAIIVMSSLYHHHHHHRHIMSMAPPS
jgi:hypothetical protein